MSYKVILSDAIDKSGLTLKEISKLCKDHGVKITESYISQLRSGKLTTPSTEISEALAHALNINPEILVIESYLDKAPEVLIEFLRRTRIFHNHDTFKFSSEELDFRSEMNKRIDSLKEELEKEPFSKFILSVNESDMMETAINYSLVSSSFYNFYDMLDLDNNIKTKPDISFEEILSITKKSPFEYETAIGDVEDDSLEPLISNGSKVVIDEKTHTPGDLVHYWDMDSQNYLIRRYYISADNIILIAPNSKYEPIIKPKSQVQILGKVTKFLSFLDDHSVSTSITSSE